MRLVAECFEAIATDYPRDFLHYIGHLPLQKEPEVLGDVDAFDVMLPSTLICGSSQRCPKGIWASKLSQYKKAASAVRDDAPTRSDSGLLSEKSVGMGAEGSTGAAANGARLSSILSRPGSAASIQRQI